MPAKALQKLLDESQQLRKQVADMNKARSIQIKRNLLATQEHIGNKRIFVLTDDIPADMVKDIAFQIAGEVQGSFCFLAATQEDGKPTLTVMLSKDLTEQFNAGNIVRSAAKIIQGGGGGQSHFATAGGKNATGLPDALMAIKKELGLA